MTGIIWMGTIMTGIVMTGTIMTCIKWIVRIISKLVETFRLSDWSIANVLFSNKTSAGWSSWDHLASVLLRIILRNTLLGRVPTRQIWLNVSSCTACSMHLFYALMKKYIKYNILLKTPRWFSWKMTENNGWFLQCQLLDIACRSTSLSAIYRKHLSLL